MATSGDEIPLLGSKVDPNVDPNAILKEAEFNRVHAESKKIDLRFWGIGVIIFLVIITVCVVFTLVLKRNSKRIVDNKLKLAGGFCDSVLHNKQNSFCGTYIE